jgi:hypothetical protein
MTHTQPPGPAAAAAVLPGLTDELNRIATAAASGHLTPAEAQSLTMLAVARDLDQVLAAFEVYRSGAQFALGCRECPGRRGSWRHLGLADLVRTAGDHYRDFHDGDEKTGGGE